MAKQLVLRDIRVRHLIGDGVEKNSGNMVLSCLKFISRYKFPKRNHSLIDLGYKSWKHGTRLLKIEQKHENQTTIS